MTDVQDKLEKILAIEDPRQRVEELLSCARDYKINTIKTLREDGSYSENELVVLIYDAQQKKRENRDSKIGMIVVAFFIFAAVAAVILLTYYMTASAQKPGS